jgi:hypothetical protein
VLRADAKSSDIVSKDKIAKGVLLAISAGPFVQMFNGRNEERI